MLVRWPDGGVRAGESSPSLQGLVDLAPTFLAGAGLPIPGPMQGVDQLPVWRGDAESARKTVIVENRHQPTRVHLRTYIDERYKITIYRGELYGELFDLIEDPEERRNLWDNPEAAAQKSSASRRACRGSRMHESGTRRRFAVRGVYCLKFGQSCGPRSQRVCSLSGS